MQISFPINFMYRSSLVVSMLMLAFFHMLHTSHAEPLTTKNPYIVIDADSGDILAGQNINDRWYPASLTKLMTAYVTFRAIKAGEIEEASPVIFSAAATRQPPSRMGYKQGVKLRIDAALKIIIIKSANDVSHALGEAVAGNLDNFISRMNREASRLGLINTQFTNSNGLHSTTQYSSARDMALLSSQILKEFPQYAYMFEAVGIKTPVKIHYSYNLLLERFAGANGMKTGFVCASGYNMAGSAKRNGRTLIAVVMGTASQTERAISTAHLLDTGFSTQTSQLGNIYTTPAQTGREPKNMRPILCTEQARSTRYDPGAGQAKLSSTHLYPRRPSSNILDVKPGGTIGVAANTSVTRIPVPTKRPEYQLNVGNVVLETIGSPATGKIPVPTQRN